MFHLLVSSQGWPEGAGSLPTSRIYIDPNKFPEFWEGDKLAIEKIRQVPALLVPETTSRGPRLARVAYITDVQQTDRETVIQYTTDTEMPQITNDDLDRKYLSLLELNRWGLSHTQWKLVNFNLFKLLLMNQQESNPCPQVFSLDAFKAQNPRLVSVMMPYAAEFDGVYQAIKDAATACAMECSRADDIWEHHTIIQDVVNLIARARIIVCDCSMRNPNVFYEIGIAHAIGKEVILIAQQKTDIPFDLGHIRSIFYLNNGEGLNALKERLESRITTVFGK